ncbi:hypothetical protein FA95DRAFT_1612538 [Auriscalpium vulgare]|uniref:Uncharacterized protein n=1 Tax=Auriscalpium vulgare TaxID=40419 RepID=A0ACB8R6U0_9AGAM|nr:hypothetical protein FA95DRAFT_1612538 [Auriscalpium vulgare]
MLFFHLASVLPPIGPRASAFSPTSLLTALSEVLPLPQADLDFLVMPDPLAVPIDIDEASVNVMASTSSFLSANYSPSSSPNALGAMAVKVKDLEAQLGAEKDLGQERAAQTAQTAENTLAAAGGLWEQALKQAGESAATATTRQMEKAKAEAAEAKAKAKAEVTEAVEKAVEKAYAALDAATRRADEQAKQAAVARAAFGVTMAVFVVFAVHVSRQK